MNSNLFVMKKFALLGLVSLSLFACSGDSAMLSKSEPVDKIEYGEFTYGEFKERTPAIPLFEHVGDEYDILAIGNGPKSRVMRTQNVCEGYDKMVVTFQAMCDGSPCEGYPTQYVTFHPFEGFFQTLVNAPSHDDYDADRDGYLLIFVEDVEWAGFYDDVQVIVMPSNSRLTAVEAECLLI